MTTGWFVPFDAIDENQSETRYHIVDRCGESNNRNGPYRSYPSRGVLRMPKWNCDGDFAIDPVEARNQNPSTAIEWWIVVVILECVATNRTPLSETKSPVVVAGQILTRAVATLDP